MARFNKNGSITARCPGCNGGLSTFEFTTGQQPYGVIPQGQIEYRFFRCAGCGRGGLGALQNLAPGQAYPAGRSNLLDFYPEGMERLPLPTGVPVGIASEFREAETCIEHKCFRAAAGLFRSVLEKVMKDNGYDDKVGNLYKKIEAAAADEILTETRKKRAHDEIRSLGNDVLHDEWQELKAEDVDLAHHYTQRILEDFYDDRGTVLKILYAKKRLAMPAGS
jgi:hypothetical protein